MQASSEMVQIKFEHAYQSYQPGQSIIWPIIPENYVKIKEWAKVVGGGRQVRSLNPGMGVSNSSENQEKVCVNLFLRPILGQNIRKNVRKGV